MGVRSRSKKSKRCRRDIGGGGGVDLISGLSDDLLVRILELLPDTRDAARTHMLSRRWRGLWTGVTALRFDSGNWPAARREAGAAEHYLAFVDDALTLRAKGTTTGRFTDLVIRFDISGHRTGQLVPPCFKAAQGWICYAVQHEVKSIVLELDLPGCYVDRLSNGDDDENMDDPVVAIDSLATSAKLETVHLAFSGAKLRLPSSSTDVVFSSLTDVSLEETMVAGHLLSRLVSPPCCPRLRKLRLTHLQFSSMEDLLLEGDALLELSVDNIENMQSLELRTPSLRVLRVELCLDLEMFTVSAPRLEDLIFKVEQPLHIVDVHNHLSSVRTLKVQLHSHGDYDGDDINDTSVHLLQCCRLTKYHKVSLEVKETKYRRGDIIKGRIPPLTHVTSLTIRAKLCEPHSFGASLSSFLAQCNNIRYLSLKFKHDYTIKQDLLCDDSCQWKSDELSLAHLQEVEFKKLVGADCEFRLLQSVLARKTGIQKVTISFDPCWWLKDNDQDAFKLVTTLLDDGLWTTCSDTKLLYKWMRCL